MIADWGHKTSDTTRNADGAVLAADPDLVVTLSANTKYLISLYVLFTSGATPDFKFRFDFSGTLTRALGILRAIQVTTPNFVPTTLPVIEADISTQVYSLPGNDTAGTEGSLYLTMMLDVGASGGDFTFLWAQNTSTASNTVVKAGSFLIAEDAT